MIWRRTLLVTLLTLGGLAFQTTLLGETTLTGTKPELLLLFTVALAMSEGPALGATAGWIMGLSSDLVLQMPHGITALTYTIIGYAVGRARAQFQTPSAWLPMAMVSVATFGGVLLYGGLAFVLSAESLAPSRVVRHAGLAAAYNALLTPFLFPVVRAFAIRMRPSGVIR